LNLELILRELLGQIRDLLAEKGTDAEDQEKRAKDDDRNSRDTT
jgi:hypothetical protein